MKSNVRRDIFFIFMMVLVLTLPFLNKPFHVDDGHFLEFSSWIGGFNPFSVERQGFNWWGDHYESVSIYEMSHPVLYFYFLSLISGLGFPNSEVSFHLVFTIFPLLTTISFYFISKKFIEKPFYAVFLLITVSGYLAYSHNIMADSPTLAFWLATVCLYMYGLDGNHRCLSFSMVPLFLAMGFSYQALSLIPLLLLLAVIKRRFSWQTTLPVIIPFFVFFLGLIYIYLRHGFFPIFASNEEYTAVGQGIKGIILLALPLKILAQKAVFLTNSIGSMFLIPLVFYLFLAKKIFKGQLNILLGAIAFSIIISFVFVGNYSLFYKLLFIIYFAAGIFILTYMVIGLMESYKRKQENNNKEMGLFLFIWCVGVIFYSIFIMPMGLVRYYFPLFPPLILLFLKVVELKIKWGLPRWFLVAVFCSQTAFALAVAKADYNLASVYRDFSRSVSSLFPTKDSSYYFSGELGFRYYMKKAGFTYFLNKAHPLNIGDIIIQPYVGFAEKRSRILSSRLKLIKKVSYKEGSPIRLIDSKTKAGFHSYNAGLLPVSFGETSIETIKIFQVKYNIAADQTVNDSPASKIRKKKVVGQTFESHVDNLSVVEVFMGTYNRVNKGKLIFHLKQSVDDRYDLRTASIHMSSVKNKEWHTFKFPPVSSAKGRKFYFFLEAPDAKGKSAVTCWMSLKDRYSNGSFYRNHVKKNGDLAFLALGE